MHLEKGMFEGLFFYGGNMSRIATLFLGLIVLVFTTGCADILSSTNDVKFTTYESLSTEVSDEGDMGIVPNENDTGDNGVGLEMYIPGMGPSTGDGGVGGMGNPNLDGGVTGGEPTNGGATLSNGEDIDMEIKIKKRCQAGEMDIIKLYMSCNEGENLIATVKDDVSERIIEDFGNGASHNGDLKDILKSVRKFSKTMKVAGLSFDIFICIDSDGDQSCTDEKVIDLAEFNPVVLMALELRKKQDGRKNIDLCKMADKLAFENGLVVFHKEFRTSKAEISKSCVKKNKVAKRMQELIRNVADLDDKKFEFAIDLENLGKEEGEKKIESTLTEGEARLVLNEADFGKCKGFGSRTNGCFVAGTKIQLNDKIHMPIETLKVGYSVQLANGKTSKISKIVQGPEIKPVVRVEVSSGQIIELTEKHPVLTENGIVQAKNLTIGSKLKNKEGFWVSIQSLSTHKYDGQVYNLELNGNSDQDHLIVSNGLVTGDLHLQNQLLSPKRLDLRFSFADYVSK